MKQLEALLVVNWYRLAPQRIPFNGNTVITGRNGAGKSALMDAMQLVCVGGNGSLFSPNARSGEGKGATQTRTVADYCLGVISTSKEANLKGGLTPRASALTYLVMCYRDTQTNEPISIGLFISAKNGQSKVEGRFACSGIELGLKDITDKVGNKGALAAKPWKDFVFNMERAKEFDKSIYWRTLNSATDLIDQSCFLLAPDRARHLDKNQWLRSLRRAIAFQPMTSTDEFVRKFILKQPEIDLVSISEEYLNYEKLQEQIEYVVGCITDLKQARDHFHAAHMAEADKLAREWAGAESYRELCCSREEALERVVEAALDKYEAAKERIPALEQEKGVLDGRRDTLTRNESQLDSDGRIAALNRQVEASDDRLKSLAGDIESLWRKAAALLDLRKSAGKISPEAREQLNALDRALEQADSVDGSQHDRLKAFCANAAQPIELLVKHLDSAHQAIERDAREAYQSHESLVDQQIELANTARKLESGVAPLSRLTEGLQQVLATDRNGQIIESTPLCDLVEVRPEKEDWRDAIEAELGRRREMLIVEDADVDPAYEQYKALPRHVRQGASIGKTHLRHEKPSKCKPDSLGACLTTDDPRAQWLIDREIGSLICAERREDITRGGHAITRDLVRARPTSIGSLKPAEVNLVGTRSRERAAQQIRDRIDRINEQIGPARQRMDDLEDTRKRVVRALDSREAFKQVDVMGRTLTSHLNERKGLEESLLAAGGEQLQQIQAQKVELMSEYEDLETRTQVARDKEMSAFSDHSVATERYERAANRTGVAAQAVSDLGTRSALDQEDASNLHAAAVERAQAYVDETPDFIRQVHFETLGVDKFEFFPSDEGPPDLDMLVHLRVMQRMQQTVRRQKEKAENQRRAGVAVLSSYLTDREKSRPATTGWAAEQWEAWGTRRLRELEETELASYKKLAEEAAEMMFRTFRSDIIVRLAEDLRALGQEIDRWNRMLKQYRFVNDKSYRFKKSPLKDYEKIRRMIEDTRDEDSAVVDDLFDPMRDSSHKHHDAHMMLFDMLKAHGGESTLPPEVDYRNYFTFDIEITDKHGNVESLNEKLKTASGGEKQVPFYMALGIAFASAYQIPPPNEGDHKGMALALFDEVFDRLDYGNITASVKLLIQMNLQVIFVVPNEKYTTVMKHMDSSIIVSLSGGNAFLNVQNLKADAIEKLVESERPRSPEEEDAMAGAESRAESKAEPDDEPGAEANPGAGDGVDSAAPTLGNKEDQAQAHGRIDPPSIAGSEARGDATGQAPNPGPHSQTGF